VSSLAIGIDPGLSGAIAFLPNAGEPWVVDMPAMEYSKKGFVKRAVDLELVARCLRAHHDSMDLDRRRAAVYLEKVNAFPGQGVASMFSLGMSYWGVAGAAAGLGMPVVLVEPEAWKRHFKLGKDKEEARLLARRLYPAVDLHRKKDHNRAEALLIARYGQMKEMM
jgi:crossover junction endodeoxyribonuclease RuvC